MPAALLVLLLPLLACGDKDDGIYEACDEAADCTVPDDTTAACLEEGDEGYCTWECSIDDDCVVDDTGASSDADQDRVCASFESTDGMYCFPSCEDDADACPDGMTCRSTGGGDDNRKVCFPDG